MFQSSRIYDNSHAAYAMVEREAWSERSAVCHAGDGGDAVARGDRRGMRTMRMEQKLKLNIIHFLSALLCFLFSANFPFSTLFAGRTQSSNIDSNLLIRAEKASAQQQCSSIIRSEIDY